MNYTVVFVLVWVTFAYWVTKYMQWVRFKRDMQSAAESIVEPIMRESIKNKLKDFYISATPDIFNRKTEIVLEWKEK